MKTNFFTFARRNKFIIYLALIAFFAFYLRAFNVNWDNNYYFHPDERAIVMFTVPLSIPPSLQNFFSIESTLNPHFFAYGNFPIYLLKFAGFIAGFINPVLSEYGGLHIVGRLISALFDTGTVIVTYALASRIFSRKVGLFSAYLYAISVFPIQLSHFFAVDTILTFFTTLVIFFALGYIEKKGSMEIVPIGLSFGLSLATKISSGIFAPIIIIAVFLKSYRRRTLNYRRIIRDIFIFILSAGFAFLITQPYALIDYKAFIEQTSLQSQMSKNAYIFPYTLQYFDKVPYLYELKNIFLWGLGPLIASLSLAGIFLVFLKLRAKNIKNATLVLIALLSVIFYFAVFGKFAVGWMRYMLPIYPLLCLFGGYMASDLADRLPKKIKSKLIYKKLALLSFILITLIYPLSFMSIYTKPNTRIQASNWINKNIPIGTVLAVEHWDDSLPVNENGNFIHVTLPLYDPDTPFKWKDINSTLKNTEYIIIASNRLYAPLQKMTECDKLPEGRCYPQTADYYKKLFSGNLGFTKVAEFSEYPTVPFFNFPLNDSTADESFTVYDHPKVMIFKKQ